MTLSASTGEREREVFIHFKAHTFELTDTHSSFKHNQTDPHKSDLSLPAGSVISREWEGDRCEAPKCSAVDSVLLLRDAERPHVLQQRKQMAWTYMK